MTVTEGAAIINAIADEWMDGKTKLSIYTITRRAANKLSKNPVFNLAAFMKYSFVLSGETDKSWLESAKEAQKILQGK